MRRSRFSRRSPAPVAPSESADSEAAVDLRQGDYLPAISAFEIAGPTTYPAPQGVAVLTQCCDLSRHAELVHLAPVVELDDGLAGDARSGRTSRYIELDAKAGRFVDLGVIGTVPMAAVMKGAQGRTELPDEQSRRKFAAGFSRRYSRYAYPDNFAAFVEPLKRELRSRSGKESSDVKRVLDLVETLRLEVEPGWSETGPLEVTLLLVVPPEHLPSLPSGEEAPAALTGKMGQIATKLLSSEHGPDRLAAWDGFGDALAALMMKGESKVPGYVTSVEAEVVSTQEFTYHRWARSTDLDLDDISRRSIERID